ncbi:MAG: GNAT family N-acetyltransferase, partial [Nostocoides sp.]
GGLQPGEREEVVDEVAHPGHRVADLAHGGRDVGRHTVLGEVLVARTDLTALKVIPPRPIRRGAAHLAISVDDLQQVMLPAWGAVERDTLGDWRLRASAGFTQRGNSVVPVGSPGLPLSTAVDRVEQWYAARGLPARFAVAGPEGFVPSDDPLGTLLLGRGYTVDGTTLNLTADSATVAAADPGGPAVRLTGELEAAWLSAYRRTRSTVPGTTEEVLLDGSAVVFASITPGGGLPPKLGLRDADAAGTTPISLARLTIGAGWAGLGAVWTDPAYRGRGLAGHVTAGLAAYARDAGTHLVHLQVEADKTSAVTLYRRMGFATHSAHAYLTQPTEGGQGQSSEP